MMSFLPNPWLITAGVVALSGAFFYGLHIGHERLEAFQAQVEALSEIQAAKNAATAARQKALTETIQNEYEDRLADIRLKFSGWVPIGPSNRAVSRVSCPSAKPDEAPADLVPLGEYRTLAGLCAETTQQLVSLQEWAAKVPGK